MSDNNKQMVTNYSRIDVLLRERNGLINILNQFRNRDHNNMEKILKIGDSEAIKKYSKKLINTEQQILELLKNEGDKND